MSFLKKLKSSKSFSVFSHNKPNVNNLSLNTNSTLANVKAIGGIERNGEMSIMPNSGHHDAMRNSSTSFFSHTKSFISNKIKSSSINSSNNTKNISMNESFNSESNSSTNTSVLTSKSPNNQTNSNTRTLIIYHIDSETEGSFSLNVKVSHILI